MQPHEHGISKSVAVIAKAEKASSSKNCIAEKVVSEKRNESPLDDRKRSFTISDSDSATVSVSNSSECSNRKRRKVAEKKQEAKEVVNTKAGTKKKALEIFCGCARLTAALNAEGFDATGVDWMGNKDRPEGRTVLIDATDQWGQQEIRKRALESDFVPAAPPCGTASKAREKRLKGNVDPKPLRSEAEPDGLSSLKGIDLQRVTAANVLYKFIAELIEELDAAGIAWSVENPRNSYMWKTRWFRRLLNNPRIKFRWLHTQMCMQGGNRDKWTSLLHGGEVNLVGMSKVCDGKHTHAPWGILRTAGGGFATAEERNYPKLFCRRIARKAASDLGIIKADKEKKPVEHRIGAGIQPRRNHNDLVPEFKEIKAFKEASDSQIKDLINAGKESKGKFPLGNLVVPGNSKVLNVWESGSSGLSDGEIGLQWNSSEFVEKATVIKHPFDEDIRVPQRIAQAMYNIAKLGPGGIAEKRRNSLKWYSEVKAGLAAREKELHKTLDEDVEKIVKTKNILLFEQMLKDVWYDDLGVSDI